MSRQLKNGKCSCWAKVNKELGKHETALTYAWGMGGTTYLEVATHYDGEKNRGIAKKMFASFCPFCGGKLKRREK